MKFLKYIALALLTLVVTGTEAKTVKVPHVYLFGFSASFQDSLVFFTDIQDIPNAWYDKKTKFLAGRDTYSEQLKTFLTEQGAPNRVCMVFFSTNKSKLEKRYLKLRKKNEELSEVVNRSITQTLTRSIYTSFTTFATIAMLFILGVPSIREFALPLMTGIIAGGFSSVCVTGPLWYIMRAGAEKKAKK